MTTTAETQSAPSPSDSSFAQEVAQAYESLPDTAPTAGRTDAEVLVDKLRRIAAAEGFEVEALLGQGGMGAVVSARDTSLGRKVALKFLTRAVADRRVGDRLKREAERASSFAHENVVQVYSWHSVQNLTFFSMEYVEGETLHQFLKKNPHASPVQVLRIIAEATAGVAAAHEAGILHRDIKPQNILIGRNGRVKVTDFGLSADVQEAMRQGGSVVVSGTVGFMAPEQASGGEESLRTDVFSLAATLYYGLTDRVPFGPVADSRDLLRANQEGRIEPLFTVREDLPQPIYKLVARALSVDPSRRFADARVFRSELEQVLLNLDHATASATRFAPLRKWLRRWSFVLGVILGFVLGFAAAFLLGLW